MDRILKPILGMMCLRARTFFENERAKIFISDVVSVVIDLFVCVAWNSLILEITFIQCIRFMRKFK